MDSLLKFLKDKIVDKMPLEEIVDVFEQMCSIPLEDDMILFETGTFSTFEPEPVFEISLVSFPKIRKKNSQFIKSVFCKNIPEMGNFQ